MGGVGLSACSRGGVFLLGGVQSHRQHSLRCPTRAFGLSESVVPLWMDRDGYCRQNRHNRKNADYRECSASFFSILPVTGRCLEPALHGRSVKEGYDTMAISSIANFASSATRLPSANCPTCGPNGSGSGNAAKSSTSRAFSGGYTGRTDSFSCATCGPQQSAMPSKATAKPSSSYCPTCAGGSKTSPFPSSSANTYNCPTCNKGPTVASKAGTAPTKNTMSWAR